MSCACCCMSRSVHPINVNLWIDFEDEVHDGLRRRREEAKGEIKGAELFPSDPIFCRPGNESIPIGGTC